MLEDQTKFGVYFSHSWRPRDVDLNLWVWDGIADSCELLVDVPEESDGDPPYYINRIEELYRRSDLFLCVLTRRDARAGEGGGNGALHCSAYSLFESRLAERFGIPKLVLYERETGFRAPPRGPRQTSMCTRPCCLWCPASARQWVAASPTRSG